MPHDAQQNLLSVGDDVYLHGKVTSISSTEDFCNITIESDLGRKPDGHKETVTLNAAVLYKAPDARCAQVGPGSMCLDFGSALNMARAGYPIARQGWNGTGMYVALQNPDGDSKMQRPYLYMFPVDGNLVPWVASQTDLLAFDWFVLNELA